MNGQDDKQSSGLTVREKLARIPPPPAFALPLVLGVLAGRWAPLPLVPPPLQSAVRAVGFMLLGLGVALTATCALQFLGRRTTIVPHRNATALVTTGPYRMTRNPMYVGLTMIYLAVALVAGVLWPLLLLPAPLLLVAGVHIPLEERTMAAAFGDEYRRYASRVRRWL
jgi:protein-S-isoprenylcysteine O-methyltransferase Ste14